LRRPLSRRGATNSTKHHRYLCGNLGAAAPLIIGRQVKAIAVLSRARSALMPELASAHEQGLTGLDVTTWTAIFLPKGAPRAIVDKLAEVTQETMDTPAIKARMLEIGVTGVAPTAIPPTRKMRRRPSASAAVGSPSGHAEDRADGAHGGARSANVPHRLYE
jgi:hypothetical protein